MAIPKELEYANEDDFVQRFLIPLLQKLGFSLVVNYHGKSEFGKDLIFAEFDRFGNVRYHALQAKYVPSIGLNEAKGLVDDAEQAFVNPFAHPQTGKVEQISSFYAVNAGTVSEQATTHYFNALKADYGGNVFLIHSKDLLALDRWATAGHRDRFIAVLHGLNLEISYNEVDVVKKVRPILEQNAHEDSRGGGVWRLRTAACSAFLCQPIVIHNFSVRNVLQYWHLADVCNRTMDSAWRPLRNQENCKMLAEAALRMLDELDRCTKLIRSDLLHVFQSLGPEVGIII